MVFAVYHMSILEGHEKFTCAGLGPMPFTRALAPAAVVFVHLCRAYTLFSSWIPTALCTLSFESLEKEQSRTPVFRKVLDLLRHF